MPLSPEDLAYHTRQWELPYRSTVHFADFIRRRAPGPLVGRVTDYCCGGGANLHWLERWGLFEAAELLGLERDPELAELARHRGVSVAEVDAATAERITDFAISIQTLSFVEDWRPLLANMLRHTRRQAFVSSLFWDGLETHTHVGAKHYNVIDEHAFHQLALDSGALEVGFETMPIDIELTAPPRSLGSYTRRGMLFSGPVYLPWRFARIRMA